MQQTSANWYSRSQRASEYNTICLIFIMELYFFSHVDYVLIENAHEVGKHTSHSRKQEVNQNRVLQGNFQVSIAVSASAEIQFH